jgi:hypothetical protein
VAAVNGGLDNSGMKSLADFVATTEDFSVVVHGRMLEQIHVLGDVTRTAPVHLPEACYWFGTFLGVVDDKWGCCCWHFIDTVKMPTGVALVTLDQAGFALDRETATGAKRRVHFLAC